MTTPSASVCDARLLRRAADAGTVTVHLVLVVLGHGSLTPGRGVVLVHVDLLVLLRHHRLLPENTNASI